MNVWYAAVGKAVLYDGVPLRVALNALSRPSKLILAGVTLWGGRLFYRVLSRAIRRNFQDDPRYDDVKSSSDWNYAAFTTFLPEAIFQAIIGLGYTFPFYAQGAKSLVIPAEYRLGVEAVAIGTWFAGFLLEGAADFQQQFYKSQGGRGLCRSGVWSIVRHPNYLGDLMTHLSYPLLLLSAGSFNPYALLGPLANWYFLRHVGGDKQTEASQEYRYRENDQAEKMLDLIESREEKNAFWPSVRELGNIWTWAVIGSGVAGVFAERALRRYY